MLLGRCYMEFTTFKVFTKQENPFEGLLRKKRDLGAEESVVHDWQENFDASTLEAEYRSHADSLMVS